MVLGNGGSPDFRARSSLGPQEAIPSLQGTLAPPNVPKQRVPVFSKAASLYHAHLPPTGVQRALWRGYSESYPISPGQPLT